jgi:hypothetical protein
MFLALLYKGLTPEEVGKEAVELEDSIVHDSYGTVAFVAVAALFAFVMWTALRANDREGKAMPPRREPSASDKTAPR